MDDGRMAQWQLAELAVKVGGLLGMPLDLAFPGSGVRIGTEGNGLHLDEPRLRRGYVEVTGWYPRTSLSFERPHVNVRADRGPGVIASEIGRRLMPRYRAALVKVGEHNAREEARQRARDQLSACITGLFPAGVARPDKYGSRTSSEVCIYLPGSQGGGTVRIYFSAEEAEFDRFRVPAAVALRMLETIALMTRFEGPA